MKRPLSAETMSGALTQVSEVLTLPVSSTLAQREETYRKIQLLYEHSDELVEEAMSDYEAGITSAKRMELAMPVVTQLNYSVHIIAALFYEVAFNGHPITPEVNDTMTTALRNIFDELHGLIQRVQEAYRERQMPEVIDPRAATLIWSVTLDAPAS